MPSLIKKSSSSQQQELSMLNHKPILITGGTLKKN